MFNQQTTTDSQNQQGFGPGHHRCGGPFRKFANKFGGKSPWDNVFNGSFGNRKAVNIEEKESSFIISLYAAGLVKSNFKISFTGDVLNIAYAAPKEDGASQSTYTYQEYQPGSFERSFQLNGKVLTDNISASYTDGVLVITLPKNPETNKPGQEINVN
ncbi:Hsp20/alpha crystallin family protein [Dyadobacter subterraneus]|uniref:Hsp20/alpha crystallin family protein n=1 Tax=Dyadobacter subterraneus TaxID=2773304 RepID=A0ABR9W804_9BACT|nr:Hsp20/alpha crystallin family protein [Dyadobacter subterraneus]MBE9461585.1 Hsp20/alpha crystallin family protein [Dyadobacter subterraneus]